RSSGGSVLNEARSSFTIPASFAPAFDSLSGRCLPARRRGRAHLGAMGSLLPFQDAAQGVLGNEDQSAESDRGQVSAPNPSMDPALGDLGGVGELLEGDEALSDERVLHGRVLRQVSRSEAR